MNSLGWVAVGGIVAAIVLLRSQQYRLLYFPQFGFQEAKMATPEDFQKRNWKKVDIEVNSKISLGGYFMMWPHEGHTVGDTWKRVPTILYLHGNAGNIGHRLPIAFSLQEASKCNVMFVAYRGFRGSTHEAPSESGLIEDGVHALKWLKTSGVDTSKVFLMGTSLGAAVTLGAATKSPIMLKGLIIENTFTSISDMTDVLLSKAVRQVSQRVTANQQLTTSVPTKTAYSCLLFFVTSLPTIWKVLKPVLLALNWNSIERIRRLPEQQNILFLSGTRDELIPVDHMNTLFAECSSKQKKFISFPFGHHNDTYCQPSWDSQIAEWINTCLEK